MRERKGRRPKCVECQAKFEIRQARRNKVVTFKNGGRVTGEDQRIARGRRTQKDYAKGILPPGVLD